MHKNFNSLMTKYVAQGWSHDSLSGQVNLCYHCQTYTLEQGLMKSSVMGILNTEHLKLKGLMACLHRKFGLCTNEFGSIFDDIKD